MFGNLFIKITQDVNKFCIGEIFGYNFSIFKFDTSKIDQGAKTTEALLAKLRADRHDLVIGYLEIFEAYVKMGKLNLSGLGWIEIPETTPLLFYIIFTMNKKGKKLLGIIN